MEHNGTEAVDRLDRRYTAYMISPEATAKRDFATAQEALTAMALYTHGQMVPDGTLFAVTGSPIPEKHLKRLQRILSK